MFRPTAQLQGQGEAELLEDNRVIDSASFFPSLVPPKLYLAVELSCHLCARRTTVCSAVIIGSNSAGGNRRRAVLLPPSTLTSRYARISIHRPFLLRLIPHTPPAENQKGRSQCRVSVTSTSKYSVDQPSSDFCSNLPGQFFLINPLSAVGFLTAQIVGEIPYLLLGTTWGIIKKYEGTDP